MQQHGSKYFARSHPTPDPRVGSKGRNSTFSDHGHAAYQIEGNHNHESSNMTANIMSTYPYPTPFG